MKVRSYFLPMSSAFLHLLLLICESHAKVYEIKVAMNDSPFFQCHVSDGCSANSPQITALLDRQKQMDLSKSSKTSSHRLVEKQSASSFEWSTDNIKSPTTTDEYHERSTDQWNIFLCYWAPLLMFLFTFGSILKFSVTSQLYEECTTKISDVAKGVVDSSTPDDKIHEISVGKNRNECYIKSIEKKLAAILLMKASLETECTRPEVLAGDFTKAIMLREKVLNQVKVQEEEIRNLQARFTVSCRIAHELTDELHHTLLRTREIMRIQCVPRASLHGACLLSGSVSCKGCELPFKEPSFSTSAKSRQLSITLADSVILRPSDFIPIVDNEKGSDDSDYLSAMTNVKKKLADDLDSMNSKLSSKTGETLNSLTSEDDSMMRNLKSTIGFDRQRKSNDGNQRANNSIGCNEYIDNDDDAQSKSHRMVNRNELNDYGLRFPTIGTDLSAPIAHREKFIHNLTDISTECTTCAGGRYHGSSAYGSDMDEDDDNDDRSCFRPLTLFSMSTLSSRQSPTTTVSSSIDNTVIVGDTHDTYDREIARLTDKLETEIKRLLLLKRESCLNSPRDDPNNIGVDLNQRLGLDFQSDSFSSAISKSNRIAPSKIPRRSSRSSSNPPTMRSEGMNVLAK